jgi:quercetin dioxygenase-like cupin family protein
MRYLIIKVSVLISIFHFPLQSCTNKPELPDPLMAGWEGSKVCELIEDNEKVRVLKCTFAPGVGHEKHYHEPHFGVALTGSTFRITDETGTRDVDVTSDSYFYSKGTEWHEVLNVGDSTAVFLIIEPK